MPISTRTKSFKKSFFPYCINERNNLKAEKLSEKLLTRLRFKFDHLKEHKFRHGFADTINPMCAYGVDV